MTNTVRYPARWAALAVISAGELVDMIDSSIINVAAPKISTDFHTSTSALQWVVGGYPLAVALGLILGGRLGDLVGRRRMFLLGIAGFAVSSAVSGLAPDIGILISFRLIQGLFAAMMLPQGLGMIREMFAEDEMQKAFGLFGPVIGLGAVFGPLLGGLLTGASWRWCFLINVPIGVAGLVWGLKTLPPSTVDRETKVDYGGTALVALFSVLLVYPLIEGRDYGWPWWTWTMLAAGVVLIGVTALQQRRRERVGRDPLVMTGIFGHRGYTAGLAYMLLFFGGLSGTVLVLALFLQLGQGFSPIGAAFAVAPLTIGLTVGVILSGVVIPPRHGRTALQAGTAFAVVGWVLVLVAALGDGRVSAWSFTPGFAVAGFGFGLTAAPLFNIVLADVLDREIGSASGVLNAVQQLSGAIGVAAIGSVFLDSVTSGYPHALRIAVVVQLCVLAAGLAITPLLPKAAREDDPLVAATPELVTTA